MYNILCRGRYDGDLLSVNSAYLITCESVLHTPQPGLFSLGSETYSLPCDAVELLGCPAQISIFFFSLSSNVPCSGVLQMQKLRTPSVDNPELTHVLSLKPGVSQNIAMHVLPPDRNVFPVLISAFLVHPPSFYSNPPLLFNCDTDSFG